MIHRLCIYTYKFLVPASTKTIISGPTDTLFGILNGLNNVGTYAREFINTVTMQKGGNTTATTNDNRRQAEETNKTK